MYPRSEQVLDFGTIAQDWARDLPQHPPMMEVFHRLLQAFWRGEVVVSGDDRRLRLLEATARFSPHPGLCVVDTPEPPWSTIYEPDGGISVIGPTLYWPQDPAGRTPETVAQAFEVLAQVELNAYCEELHPIFWGLEIEREDFADFCNRNGYDQPKFWFRRKLALAHHDAAIACRRWIKAKVKLHGETKPPRLRACYHRMAKKLGLPDTRSKEIWTKEVPQSWKRVGRPRNP